ASRYTSSIHSDFVTRAFRCFCFCGCFSNPQPSSIRTNTRKKEGNGKRNGAEQEDTKPCKSSGYFLQAKIGTVDKRRASSLFSAMLNLPSSFSRPRESSTSLPATIDPATKARSTLALARLWLNIPVGSKFNKWEQEIDFESLRVIYDNCRKVILGPRYGHLSGPSASVNDGDGWTR
ncbi:hypothetical protein KI387_002183, partial [Taxus chinensis]